MIEGCACTNTVLLELKSLTALLGVMVITNNGTNYYNKTHSLNHILAFKSTPSKHMTFFLHTHLIFYRIYLLIFPSIHKQV